MIYDSPEIIPAKIYFKILETGDINLLCHNETSTLKVLEPIWQKVQDEYNSSTKEKSKHFNKVFNISKQLEAIESGLKFVEFALYHLRSVKDDDLIQKLKDEGYSFNWKKPKKDTKKTEEVFKNDLDRVERESEALDFKIKRLTKQLPKVDTETNDVPFDETILMYSAFTGLGYIDPNKLPLTQYDALIENGNKKMKALNKGKK